MGHLRFNIDDKVDNIIYICVTGYLSIIEDASAIICADDCILPILTKVGSSDEACLPIHLIPQRHLLVWNVPEP